ncbi:MAG TPA: DUF58 domain-containing protein [Planctomycetia bacterium]|nr:DUF58 domain-containing protein [Planctomycetia bacterium]
MAESPKYSSPEALAKVAGLGMRARQVVEGPISGHHRSPFHGFSVEFAEYREYSPGDDLRRLDWRVFARSDRFYTKRYEEETNLRAHLVIDASASMKYKSGALSKYDYGCTLAVCLAHLLVGQRDPVGLALVDKEQRTVIPPSATQAQLVRIVDTLENSQPDRETELGGVLQEIADRIRQRGMVVIVSDLLTDLDAFYEALSRLQYRGHEILVCQVLDRDETELPFRDLVVFRDMEGTEELFAEPWAFRKHYKEVMQQFITDVKDRCLARGMDHLLFHTDEDLGDALSRFLHARERA